MENKNIINRVEDLKFNSESRMNGIQKGLVPEFIDLHTYVPKSTPTQSSNKAEYNIGETTYYLTDDAYFVIRVRNLPYNDSIRTRNPRYSIDPLETLIAGEYLRPVLLFYDNKFVPWSKIRVVTNKYDSFIIIDGLVDDTKELKCISFPFTVSYNETGIGKQNPSLIAVFNENGELDDRGKIVISACNPNIYIVRATCNTAIHHTEIDIPDFYLCNDFGCILFKNNVLYTDGKINFEGYNILTVDDGRIGDYSLSYIFFYDFATNTNAGNPNIIPNKQPIKTAIKTDNLMLKRLAEPLDFTFNPNSEYAVNINRALTKIVQHNTSLMETIYQETSRIKMVLYTGAEFKGLVKNGEISFASQWVEAEAKSCRHNPTSPITYDERSLVEVRPIIFINGELYRYMNTMRVENGKCHVDIDTSIISNTDKVVVMFFKDINNEIIISDAVIGEDNVIDHACSSDVLSKIRADNLAIYSPECPSDAIFPMTSIDEFDRVQYALPISVINNDTSDQVNIVIDTEYDFTGPRTLAFVSKNQFHHLGVIIYNEYQINIELTPEFNYCTNKEQYMIFINGRKLEQKHFKLICADPKYPFDDVSIYLFVELKKNDRLDIFYLPFVCTEQVIKPNIQTNGNIYLSKETLNYSLSKNSHLFFINGRFIDPRDIAGIDDTRVCILNTESVDNLCILQHIPVNTILSELFNDENIVSTWNYVFGKLDDDTIHEILNIPKNIQHQSTEDDIYAWQLTHKEVLFEIARDYWLSERIYSGDVIVYNYENLEITQDDYINNETAKAEDFDKKDPTGKLIANLQHGHVDFRRMHNGVPATKDEIDAFNITHPKK